MKKTVVCTLSLHLILNLLHDLVFNDRMEQALCFLGFTVLEYGNEGHNEQSGRADCPMYSAGFTSNTRHCKHSIK